MGVPGPIRMNRSRVSCPSASDLPGPRNCTSYRGGGSEVALSDHGQDGNSGDQAGRQRGSRPGMPTRTTGGGPRTHGEPLRVPKHVAAVSLRFRASLIRPCGAPPPGEKVREGGKGKTQKAKVRLRGTFSGREKGNHVLLPPGEGGRGGGRYGRMRGEPAGVRATTLIRPSGTFSRGEKVRTPLHRDRADPREK